MTSVLIFATLLSACGGGGGSSAASGGTSDPGTGGGSNPPALPVWRVEVEGGPTTFSLSMVTDSGLATEQQVTQGPAIAVPNGSIVAFSATGYNFSSGGVTRTGGTNVSSGGPWMMIRLYKNGVQIESAQLSTNGTSHTFSAH